MDRLFEQIGEQLGVGDHDIVTCIGGKYPPAFFPCFWSEGGAQPELKTLYVG